MLSRISYLIPVGATVVAFTPTTVFAAANTHSQCSSPARVYDEPKKDPGNNSQAESECGDTELERLVMQCREQLAPYKGAVVEYTNSATSTLIGAYGSFKDNICYLRTRAPDEVRIGSIVAGGLFGMMFGMRRGLFRKLIFGSMGAGGMSYLVYPNQTIDYASTGSDLAKKYFNIAYNFALGIDPSSSR